MKKENSQSTNFSDDFYRMLEIQAVCIEELSS